MAAVLQCPDRATMLRLFVQGGGHEEIESLAGHLERCARCGEQFDELLRNDDVTLGLGRSFDDTAIPNREALKTLRERLGRLRPQVASDKTVDTIAAGSTAIPDVAPLAALPMSGTEVELNFLAPPQEPDEIGRLGPYRVLKKLGAGGMGMVFLAEDPLLKRKVALKTMLPTVAANPQARKRFLREARAAAAIEHAHIIAVHQVGEDNGVPYLAMPLLKGESLGDRLARDAKLPAAEAVRIAYEMADGLAAAHAEGLIHRDIKPGNVWLETKNEPRPSGSGAAPAPLPDGRGSSFRVKILDFGLARSQADDTHLTHSGAIVGTPAFMAPEQARGLPIDARADLFSLGCVLYVMLTGQRPFTGDTTMALLTALALDTPKSPRAVNPAIPAVLSDFTMRLLAKKPKDRPASALHVLDELRAVARAAGEAKKAAPPAPAQSSATETAVRPAPAKALAKTFARPRRRVAVLVALALLFLIGGGFAAYQLVFKTKDGTLLVEVDGDADVRFKDGELHIYGSDGQLKYTLKPGERSKTMPPGPYRVQVVSADGVKLETPEFTMTKNGAKVRVTVAGVALAKGNPKALSAPKREFALEFNGIDSLVEIATLRPPADGPVTVELWVNPGAKRDFGTMLEITGDSRMLKLHHVNQLWMGDSWNAEKSALDFHETPFTALERWAHVALCWDGKTQTLFADGVKITTSLKPYPCPRPESRPAMLGCGTFGVGTYSEFLRGSISEVRVSKSIRYKENFTPQARFVADNDTVALYHCDEGQGVKLTDASGNEHHGKIVGAKWVKVDASPATSPDRKAAEWVLSVGGTVKTRASGQDRFVAAEKDLPADAFELIDVFLAGKAQVADADLKRFQQLPALSTLDLTGTNVTDAGLELIKDLPALWTLTLDKTKVTGPGLHHLATLPELTNLGLQDTQVDDASLEHLKTLSSNFASLQLGGTKVTDAGLEHLKPLTNLGQLYLDRTKVSDAGLEHLRALKRLSILHLKGTKVSDGGAKKISATLPGCRITWDGGTIEPKK